MMEFGFCMNSGCIVSLDLNRTVLAKTLLFIQSHRRVDVPHFTLESCPEAPAHGKQNMVGRDSCLK